MSTINSSVEQVEKNKVKFTFEVDAKRFEEGMKYSYNKNRGKINIQGFRKGRAPRQIIEMQYGKEMFYEDAINFVLPDAYESAVKEHDVEIVSRASFDVVEVSTEKGVVMTAEVYTKPEVEIDGYLGITYSKFETEAIDEDINAEIVAAQEKNARIITITDRNIENSDIVVLDFEGFINDEPFEGGKAEDHELVIGSKTFIDTFEEQLIGHGVDEEFDVNVTFPENYGKEELQNAKALFKVKIKEIKVKELPEIDDDFAQDVSEFDTLAEYKESIGVKIREKKLHEAEHDKENKVMEKVIEKAVVDVPEVMIEDQMEELVENMGRRLSAQGLPLEMYLQYMGQTMESLRESQRTPAEMQVKGRLVLEAIAKKENIEITDEEIDEEIGRIAEMYKMEKEKLATTIHEKEKESLSKDLRVQKALKLILDSAVEMNIE